jgi:4-carboxymuconolactone decarboxylase
MVSREELREKGRQVVETLKHGAHPPRARPLYQSTIPGLEHLTGEALWGSIWSRPGLGLRDRMLATLAVLTSLQRMHQLRTYLSSALNIGVPGPEIQEVLIQCSLYAGFPTTVNGTELMRDVLERRGEEVTPPDVAEVPLEEMERRGRALYVRLFGEEPAPASESAVEAHLLGIELSYACGEVLQRPGLDLRGRAIVAVAASIALRDTGELRRWLPAALRAGLTRAEVDEVLAQCAYYAGFSAARQAFAVAAEVFGG